MPEFTALRRVHRHTQLNDAPPARVFLLLCPVREAAWVPGWKYRLIYSESGVAEDGCVFTTPNDRGPETVWQVTHYDPTNFRIAFAWVEPNFVATQLRISLSPAPDGKTHADIRYVYTGLSPEGNAEIERCTPEWFAQKMQGWETAINHFLGTGKLLEARAWE